MGETAGKVIVYGILVLFIIYLMVSCLRSFSEQGVTRSYGGEMDVDLEPNRKLVEVTWKDANLWYLTKAMTDDDVAEDYVFQEKDPLGWMEGSVIIHEHKMSREEYLKYLEKKQLETDYYREGNFIYDENTGETREVFISYNMETGIYEKLKNYQVDEYGMLIEK